jgi:ribose transport system ATP-binding protein
MGSGFDEIPYLIFGARRASNGVLTIDGVDFPLAEMSPPRALRAGLVLLPANRQYDGGVANLSVSDNMMLPVLDRLKGPVGLRRRAMSATAQSLLLQFEVRPPRPEALYETLSGGNQQKVLLAKWMQLDPRVLLLHEPTQGVDVGARATIFQRVTDAARAGAAIVIASSDNEQLALLCHRVLVFSHGRVVREMSGTITKDIISEHVYGRNTAANS